tara:strand:- start:587 stop:718 length:132 start_codon:yes stop_codon:yes gene_type:complete
MWDIKPLDAPILVSQFGKNNKFHLFQLFFGLIAPKTGIIGIAR